MIPDALKHLGWNTLLLIGSGLFVFLLKDSFGVVEIVSALKLASLAILVLANGEIAVDISRGRKDVRNMNYAILMVVIVVLFFQFLKILNFNLPTDGVRENTILVFSFAQDNIFWLSAIPIFLYALLDFYIAFGKGSAGDERLVARLYIMFVDIPIILPLVLVFAMTAALVRISPSELSLDLFISGSMAIIIIASSVATKAVNLMEENLVRAAQGTRL